jgi:iron complex outermembrane receptor protein
MDGSQFLRERLGLRVKMDNLGELFSALDGQVY